MFICRITYLSENFHVHAYLAFPTVCRATRETVHAWLADFYHKPMQVDEIALSIRHNDGVHETNAQLGTLPALVYCRGGIGNVGRVRPEWIMEFARHGYIVVAPCYRGSEGGEGRDEFGGSDQFDVESAIELLMSHPMVSRSAISLLGFSRGSINATQAASRFPLAHSLVLFGGVSDLAATYAERVDLRRMLKRVLGGTPTKAPEKYIARSPIHLLATVHCPILLVHGVRDIQVAFRHAVWMCQALELRQPPHDFMIYSDQGHHLSPPLYLAAAERICQWMHTAGST